MEVRRFRVMAWDVVFGFGLGVYLSLIHISEPTRPP